MVDYIDNNMKVRTRGPRIDCAVDAAMAMIEGRWKAAILCKLYIKGTLRFNQLSKEMEIISPRILTRQLRELEEDGLVNRTARTEVPVSVEYSLSEKGKDMIPALKLLAEWSINNVLRYNVHFDEDVIIPNRDSDA
jgi:DNA-binding HxlR family transcriptional regulator